MAETQQSCGNGLPETQILLVHASSVDVGGVVNATLFYATALNAVGYSAEIWTASRGLERRANSLGIRVFRHAALDGAVSACIHPTVVTRASCLKKTLKAVIHQGDKGWAFGRLWLGGVPEMVVFHNRRLALRTWFKTWLAISSEHETELCGYAVSRGLKRRIALIRNGPLPSTSCVAEAPVRKGVGVIGSMSNFGAKKAMSLLVTAFARANLVDVRLVLAGAGDDLACCKELAIQLGVDDRVEFTGWLEDTDAFYAKIDVFCSPSNEEPFGLVMAEAMQASLPVVATSTAGARDLVIAGETGWLVPVGDADALADGLRAVVSDPGLAIRFGAAGRRRFLEICSPLAAGRLLIDVLGLPQRAVDLN